ncbi:hypothetical protein LguiA_001808 [Lonicera macranthoides]
MDSDTVMCQKVVGRVQRGIVARHSGIVARQTAEVMGSDTVMCQKVVGRVQRGLSRDKGMIVARQCDMSDFNAVLKSAANRSQGCATEVILPKFCTTEELLYLSENVRMRLHRNRDFASKGDREILLKHNKSLVA